MWLRNKKTGKIEFDISLNDDNHRLNDGTYENGDGNMYIVAGMIGAGKSTLTELLANHYNATAFYEPVNGNEVLEKFYDNKEEYGFLLQIDFLHRRFQMIKDAGKLDRAGQITILDRSIWEDEYFTEKNHELGNIEGIEMRTYQRALNNMMEEIDTLPKKNADVLIYIKSPFEKILQNIKKRDRDFEQSGADYDYFKLLYDGYDEWFENYAYGPKIKIDLTHYDLSVPEEAEIILQKIDSEIKLIEAGKK